MVRYVRHADGAQQAAERYAHFREHNPRQFRIVEGHNDEEVGWMAYWERIWNDEQVFEIGWAVLPKFRDMDLRRAAIQAIDSATSEGVARLLLACPSADNERTNMVCRQIGFTLLEQRELEYEPGSLVACNVWSLDPA
jgi:RimJ/RimL family protein N-acetyltransferase